ncbi:alpha/beta fold hydrolase [Aliagarivorans taiwanensis]|uniref:alpha/beta fold hydrolase n=1 Tax=Aliagarivorans taiwanensis TaxID=561966 RepID=UPI0004085CC1|nr:alpha/beta fold hydrolase [Aliagarivorans taiwanensis]
MDATTNIPESLLSQIYDAALQPESWPTLLEGLSHYLVELSQQDVAQVVGGEALASGSASSVVLRGLTEHVRRSAIIGERLGVEQTGQTLLQQLLEQLPLPALLLDQQVQLQALNRRARTLLESGRLAGSLKHRVSFPKRAMQQQLQQAMDTLFSPAETLSECSFASTSEIQPPYSVSLIKVLTDGAYANQVLMLIADFSDSYVADIDKMTLAFDLTRAEQQLVTRLVAGDKLHEIAEHGGVSINTVRTQLKAVFGKTGCHSQSELMRIAMLNPRTYQAAQDPLASLTQRHNMSAASFHCKVSLRDGRTLGYSDIGRPDDPVLVMFPPSTGSRLQHHPCRQWLFDYGVRVIVVDRPGYGLSSPLPERSLLDHGNDIAELAEQLALDEFVVAGFCGGGAYALAACEVLSSRIRHAHLISSVTPYEAISLFHGVKSSNKLLAYLVLNAPQIANPLIALMSKVIIRQPNSYFDQVYASLGESDKQALNEPALLDNFVLALSEALRQGPQALAQDLRVLAQPWPMKLADLTTPLTLWHGEQDQHVPIRFARLLAQALPELEFRSYAEHGHLLIYHCWNELLACVAEC